MEESKPVGGKAGGATPGAPGGSGAPGAGSLSWAGGWIAWVREAHYRVADLGQLWGVPAPVLERFCLGVHLPWPDYWLALVQRWDALFLVTREWTRAQIEAALDIAEPAAFWYWFEGEFGPRSGRELREMAEDQRAPYLEALEEDYGPDPIPEQKVPAWPWEHAWHALSPEETIGAPQAGAIGGATVSSLLQCLHKPIRRQCPDARETVAYLALEPLKAWLRSRFAGARDDFVWDTATDVVLDYLGRPERYDPNRRTSLWTFLHLRAESRMLTRLKRKNEESEKISLSEENALGIGAPSANTVKMASRATVSREPPTVLPSELEDLLGALRGRIESLGEPARTVGLFLLEGLKREGRLPAVTEIKRAMDLSHGTTVRRRKEIVQLIQSVASDRGLQP